MFGQMIDAPEAKRLIQEEQAILIDIRRKEEYEIKHIEGCTLIPLEKIAFEVEEHVTDYDTPIIIYCRSGHRTKMAAVILNDLGYSRIYDLGALENWYKE